MTRIIIAIYFTFFISNLFAQNYQSKFAEIFWEKDTIALTSLLKEWEKSNSNDPELYISYFNYYFYLSKQENLDFEPEPKGEESFPVMDTSNQVMGYVVENSNYNSVELNNAFNYIDIGIKKFPSRLDIRFGKIYALGVNKKWKEFSEEIINAINHSNTIKYKWIWKNNEPLNNSKYYFLNNIRIYLDQLYNTKDNSLLIYIRNVSETLLKYDPSYIESLLNISTTYIMVNDLHKGLQPLLKAEKINPQHQTVLSSIARVYKLMKNNKKAIEYYELTMKYGDDTIKQFAKQQIDLLNTD